MENQRFQPYRGQRRAYRSWLGAPNPVPPPATLARMRRRALRIQQNQNENEPNRHHNVNEAGVRDPNQQAAENGDGEPDLQEEIPADVRSNADSLDNDERSEAGDPLSGSDVESEDDLDDNEEDMEGIPGRLPHLEERLFPGGDCSKFECLLMILSFSLRHGLTQVAMQDLCTMVNHILRGNYLPTGKKMLKKVFGRSTFKVNFYCKRCQHLVIRKGSQEQMQGVYPCQLCRVECTLANMNEGHFFVTFAVKDQLKFLLENTENVVELLNHRWNRNQDPNYISDVYDGKVYSDLCKDNNFLSERYNLSLTINTDGAQVFESTNNTLWPIFFRINEFPPTVRFLFSNCLLGGLWFSSHEPNMRLFLSSFVRELDDLYETGFHWKTPTGDNIESKAILLNCVADSKAKPLVQNCKTHNGYWGCGYCFHPGVVYEGSSQAKYPMNDALALRFDNSFTYTVSAPDPVSKEIKVFSVEDRKNENTRRDMELAEVNRNPVGKGDIKGVTGKSILADLPTFDVVFGFPVDYMHGVLLGVTRHVTNLWFDSTSSTRLYYVGLRIDSVNRKLLNIRPPVTISRRPRKISDRNKWHANEWRSWLLYYSLPCMDGILPTRYLRHHCLLVTAIYILLQDRISREDIDRATYHLGAYCAEFLTLYSEPMMRFNVHLLLHLGKCVTLHGPLFCFSAFSFESANGKLVNLVKGTKGVLNQIAEKYSKCKILPKVVEMYTVRDATIKYCEDIMSYHPAKTAYNFNNITVLGPAKTFPLSEEETNALLQSGHNITSASYERMIIESVMFHARCYTRKGDKSDSSIVQLKCGAFGAIERIIDPANFRGPSEPTVLVLLRGINIVRQPIISHHGGAKAEHILKCSPIVYGHLTVIKATDIKKLAILIDCLNKTFITTFPNMIEKD